MDKYGLLNADFLKYVKYVAIEEGLSGFRIEKKVGDFILGYHDEMLEEVKSMPFEQGGDPTVDSFISIAQKQTTPFNASTAFFCGNDKSELVRSYASWIGN